MREGSVRQEQGRWGRHWQGIGLALALALCGCGDSLTEIVVIVDSDLRVPQEMERVGLTVVGTTGETVVEAAVSLREPDGRSLPVTLSLRPEGPALGPVEVTATALDEAGPVVSIAAETAFVAGERRSLQLFLASACVEVDCGPDETCGAGGSCQPRRRPGEELPPWPP